jgi:hypothetical protein
MPPSLEPVHGTHRANRKRGTGCAAGRAASSSLQIQRSEIRSRKSEVGSQRTKVRDRQSVVKTNNQALLHHSIVRFLTSDSRLLISDLWPPTFFAMSSPGIEPGLRPSQGRVRIHYTSRTKLSWKSEVKNTLCRIAPTSNFRIPTSHFAKRADDWIRTSMDRLTRPAPF